MDHETQASALVERLFDNLLGAATVLPIEHDFFRCYRLVS